MANQPLLRFESEKARELLLRDLKKRRFGRVNPYKAGAIFNESSWPFALEVEVII